MSTARVLRSEIEAALANKIPAALSPAPRTYRTAAPTGIQNLDDLLGGGLPSAAITELVGAQCSGRTTTALTYIASLTRTGTVCAWIDVSDALDPESAAANGIALERLLWVRCTGTTVRTGIESPGSDAVPLVGTALHSPAHTGSGSPHPRSEGRGMPQAIAAMLHAHGGVADRQTRREKKSIGTPSAPNRPLSNRSEEREEQVNSDRLPARRGDNLTIAPRCAEPQPRRIASVASGERMSSKRTPRNAMGGSAIAHPWKALDQALRATDLLLQGGGFSAIVLDLGSTPPDVAWRIPLATWFRFRAACERTRVSLLLLTQHPCARSSAELVVRLETGTMEGEGRVMTGIRYRAVTERSRFQQNDGRVVPIRKPPQSERPGQWKSKGAWAQTK